MAFFKSLICCALVFGIVSAEFRSLFPSVTPSLLPPTREERSVLMPSFRRFVRAAPPSGAVYNANPREIQVTAYSNNIDPNTNTFQYGYQQTDGAAVSAKGFLNQNGKQVIEGSYAFVDAAGNPVQIQYVADENGYQAVGDAVPQPDPVIVKAVAYLRSLPPSAANEKQ